MLGLVEKLTNVLSTVTAVIDITHIPLLLVSRHTCFSTVLSDPVCGKPTHNYPVPRTLCACEVACTKTRK